MDILGVGYRSNETHTVIYDGSRTSYSDHINNIEKWRIQCNYSWNVWVLPI